MVSVWLVKIEVSGVVSVLIIMQTASRLTEQNL